MKKYPVLDGLARQKTLSGKVRGNFKQIREWSRAAAPPFVLAAAITQILIGLSMFVDYSAK